MRILSRLAVALLALSLAAFIVPSWLNREWSHFSTGWVYVDSYYTTPRGALVKYRDVFRIRPNEESRLVEIEHYEPRVLVELAQEDAFRLANALRYLAETPAGGQRWENGQRWSAFTWTDANGTTHGWIEFRSYRNLTTGETVQEVYDVYIPPDQMNAMADQLEKARAALVD